MEHTFYHDSHVAARIREFLGERPGEEASACYLCADNVYRTKLLPLSALDSLLDGATEIGRSLWDRDALLADLDIEYVNFDRPAEAFLDPQRIFALQTPVEAAASRIFRRSGIETLHCLSGRGHHFFWKIRQGSEVFQELAGLGAGPPTLWQRNAQRHPPTNQTIDPSLARAWAGLGLVMEYLAHRIKEKAAPRIPIPVELTAVEVGGGEHGREMVSIDLSEYGDPLYCRAVRVPYSHYLKPHHQWWLHGEETLRRIPDLFSIPLHGQSLQEGLRIMRDPRRVADFAKEAPARIPDATRAMARLLRAYEASSLARFHRWFYAEEHDAPERWGETYDRTPLEILPPCARNVLAQPNDLLLRPGGLRMVTRVLLALGWHPRHIAGLVRSKFERDYGWGGQWTEADPATRADFYIRVFSGLFFTGRDDLVDFNCRSAQEAGACPCADCPGNLERYRRAALSRRDYENLADRPFHGQLSST